MTMTTNFLHRLSPRRLACVATLAVMACASPSHAQSVAVMVNGDPITSYDIEQRSKLNVLSTHKPADRQQVINDLVDEKLRSRKPRNSASIPPPPTSIRPMRR